MTYRLPSGETIRQAMRRQGLTAYRLAQLVPCSQQTALDWQAGRRHPSPIFVAPLCKALGAYPKGTK